MNSINTCVAGASPGLKGAGVGWTGGFQWPQRVSDMKRGLQWSNYIDVLGRPEQWDGMASGDLGANFCSSDSNSEQHLRSPQKNWKNQAHLGRL